MEDTVVQSFRTAVGGFHKGDVMNYISQTAEKHEKELQEKDRYIAELKAENQTLKEKIEALNTSIAQLCLAPKTPEPEPEPVAAPVQQTETSSLNEQELAAYRRAEQVERFANVRARKKYQELADFSAAMESVYGDSESQVQQVLTALSDQISELSRIREKLSAATETCRNRAAESEGTDDFED